MNVLSMFVTCDVHDASNNHAIIIITVIIITVNFSGNNGR